MLFEETAKRSFFDKKSVLANSNLQKDLSTFYWNRNLLKNIMNLLIKHDSSSMSYKREESFTGQTLKGCLIFSPLKSMQFETHGVCFTRESLTVGWSERLRLQLH